MKYLPYPAPVPLDKGNAGTENETATIFLKESRIRESEDLR